MGRSKVGVALQLPPLRLRASEITFLEAGMVLRLPVARHEISEIRIGGLQLAKARPVRNGDHRGALVEGADTTQRSGDDMRVN
jgi:flagellar motor switch protein FliM